MAETIPRPNRVELKVSGATRHEKAVANGALVPGNLLQMAAGDKVVVHTTAGGRGELLISKEDALQGKTITDAYASGDVVPYILALPGDEVFVQLKAEQNASENSLLTSNGDGTLKVAAIGNEVVAIAREALDLTGLATAHLKVRITPQSVAP